MDKDIQIAFITAVAPTLAALAALYIGIQNRKKADTTLEKTNTLIEKTAEIHTLTNSNLSKVTAALAVANTKIEGLEKLIASINRKGK